MRKVIDEYVDGDYDGEFVQYEDIATVHGYRHGDLETITKNIHDKLVKSV